MAVAIAERVRRDVVGSRERPAAVRLLLCWRWWWWWPADCCDERFRGRLVEWVEFAQEVLL